jgi:hypothetical protein
MFAFLPPFLFYFPLSFLSFLNKAPIPSLFLLGSQYCYSGSCNYNYPDVKQLRWNDWFENLGLRQTLRKKWLRLLQIDLLLLLLQYWCQNRILKQNSTIYYSIHVHVHGENFSHISRRHADCKTTICF